MTIEENQKKSTSERLSEILPQLSKDQLRYVIARQEHPTKKDAAVSIGMKANTAYNWNGLVEEAVELMALESVESARIMNRKVIPKAMAVKIAALDSDNEAIRQKAATELIEWMTGKAPQPLTGEGGGPLAIAMVEVIKDYGE